jgi:hypothetical protein
LWPERKCCSPSRLPWRWGVASFFSFAVGRRAVHHGGSLLFYSTTGASSEVMCPYANLYVVIQYVPVDSPQDAQAAPSMTAHLLQSRDRKSTRCPGVTLEEVLYIRTVHIYTLKSWKWDLYARRHSDATSALDGYRPRSTPLYSLSYFPNISLVDPSAATILIVLHVLHVLHLLCCPALYGCVIVACHLHLHLSSALRTCVSLSRPPNSMRSFRYIASSN